MFSLFIFKKWHKIDINSSNVSYEVVFEHFVNGLMKHSKSIKLSDGNLIPESLFHKSNTINFKICAIKAMSYCILVSKILL